MNLRGFVASWLVASSLVLGAAGAAVPASASLIFGFRQPLAPIT